MTPLRNRNH